MKCHQCKKLFKEIKEAQDNNKNQMGYEFELNRLGYTYNPFTRRLCKNT